MTRTVTGLCVAAAFGMVASLGAQTTGQTTGTTEPRSHSATSDHTRGEVTVTGCLQKGADGNYILTDARVDNGMGAMGSTSGSMHGTTGTTSGTTGTSTTTGSTTAATTTAESSRMGSAAMTWQLSGGHDLDKHVGHKIQVTGRAEMNSSRQNENYSASSTGTTAGTTTGSTAGTTGTTTGSTAGTTGTTSETGSMQHQGMTGSTAGQATAHRLDVKSVKMISTSCS